MYLRSCIITLLVVYPVFLATGIVFYRHIQKTRPNPLPPSNPRARFVRPWRFAMYIVLLPLAVTLSLAALGWLDPLFHLIQALR